MNKPIATLFSGNANGADKELLKQRAEQLLRGFVKTSHDNDFVDQINSHYFSDYGLAESSEINLESLERIKLALKENRKITESQLEYFLCSVPWKDRKALLWQQLVLAAALEHARRFSKSGRSLNALMSFRLLIEELNEAKDKNQFTVALVIINELPDSKLYLSEIVSKINHYIDESEDKVIRQRLMPLRRILDDLVKDEVRNKRSRKKGARLSGNQKKEREKENNALEEPIPEEITGLNVTWIQCRTDEDEPESFLIKEQPKIQDDAVEANGNSVEFEADNAPDRLYAYVTSDADVSYAIRRSYAMSATRCRSAASAIER